MNIVRWKVECAVCQNAYPNHWSKLVHHYVKYNLIKHPPFEATMHIMGT